MSTLIAADPQRPRILIAEDESLIRLDLRALLEERGWDVCGEARDGREAVQLARELEPDVTLMDVSMPDIDGIEATRLIQSKRRTPVVMMTAHNRPSLLARSISAGAISYVLKPFAEDDLVATIASAPSRLDFARSRAQRTQSLRRAEIIAAAKHLFAEQGYDRTSIEQVAEHVGLLKGSLYQHIASKQEALVITVGEFLAAAAAGRRHATTTSGGARRRLEAFVLARRALHTFDREGSAILARCTSSLPAHDLRTVRREAVIDRRFLLDVLAEGDRQGVFRLAGDPAEVAGMILSLVSAPPSLQGHSLSDTDIDASASSCASFVLAALGAGRSQAAARERAA
jgi:DNA-binding NarL/FixJ family response regulator